MLMYLCVRTYTCTHVSGHKFNLVYLFGFFFMDLPGNILRKMLNTELGHLFSLQKPMSIIKPYRRGDIRV